MKYIKCPRCDLNYMSAEEKYCDVCKAELKLDSPIKFVALEDDEPEQVLCPICKRNYMDYGESMCRECKEESNEKLMLEPDTDVDPDSDEEWRNFLDEDEKDAISNKGDEETISLSQLEEEEAKELFDDDTEEEEEFFENPADDDDDFEYVDAGEGYDEDDEEEEEDGEDF